MARAWHQSPSDVGRSRSAVPDPRQWRGSEPSKRVSLGTPNQCLRRITLVLLRGASRPPEVVAADFLAEVQRLESTIAVLGESNPYAGPLESLSSCEIQIQSPALWQTGSERARTVIERANQVVRAARTPREPKNSKTCTSPRWRMLSEDCHSCRRSPPNPRPRCVPVPDVGDLQRQNLTQVPHATVCSGWLSDRNCELRNASVLSQGRWRQSGRWEVEIIQDVFTGRRS